MTLVVSPVTRKTMFDAVNGVPGVPAPEGNVYPRASGIVSSTVKGTADATFAPMRPPSAASHSDIAGARIESFLERLQRKLWYPSGEQTIFAAPGRTSRPP